MHAWDVIGYVFDGTIYCPEHVPQATEGCEPPPETFTVVGYYPDTGEAFADDVSALSARAAAEEAPSGVIVLCVFAGSQTDLLAGEQ